MSVVREGLTSSRKPLNAGDLRHRLLVHHLPIALASSLALILLMTIPTGRLATFSAVRFRDQAGCRWSCWEWVPPGPASAFGS